MTPPRLSKPRGPTRSTTGTRARRTHAAEIPLRPIVWTIHGTRWMVLDDATQTHGTVTVQPLDMNGTLTGKPVRLNTSEWRSAQRSGAQEPAA